MIKGSRNAGSQRVKSSKKTGSKKPGDDRPIDFGSRAKRQHSGDLPPREHSAHAVLQLEKKIQRGRNQFSSLDETWPKNKGPRKGSTGSRKQKTQSGAGGVIHRTFTAEKKRELGLHGDLRGRHLSHEVRSSLLREINDAVIKGGAFEAVCRVLELNPRAVYRWKSGITSSQSHGGGGGKNKITPLEEKRVVALAKKFPEFRCRRIAYELERQSRFLLEKRRLRKF